MTSTIVFSTATYEYLRDEIASIGGWGIGSVDRRVFPDGERYQRVVSDVADKDVLLVGGTISDVDTLELYDLACALSKYGARRLTIVMPFFGYSTMERASRPGEVVTGKTRARLLSSIPPAAMGNCLFLLDLHVSAIAHYVEGNLRSVHVNGKSIVAAAARRLGGNDFILACTDAGRAKWVESLANDLGVIPAFVYKRRLDGDRTEVTGVSAQVQGKRVVIYDDMIRTGGSLINAAAAYREAGAAAIDAIATHGVLPGDSLARIEGSGLFGSLLVTNSHPQAVRLQSPFLQVESVAALLVDQIRNNR
jgi:ribose-phosphate pyrophosphokinase